MQQNAYFVTAWEVREERNLDPFSLLYDMSSGLQCLTRGLPRLEEAEEEGDPVGGPAVST